MAEKSRRKTKRKKRRKRPKQIQTVPLKTEKKKKTSKRQPTLCTKDLMKLGKQELVKRCKKSNLACTGSKKEMVARILHQAKMAKENNVWLKHLNGLSALQATQLIINGYVHYESNHKYHMYADIVSIIAQFVNLVLVRFDLVNKKYNNVIQNKGSLIKRQSINFVAKKRIIASKFIIGCSMGYNIGVHKWKIKIINGRVCDWIGIITNNKLCTESQVNIFDHPWKKKSIGYMLVGGRKLRRLNCPFLRRRYNYWGYEQIPSGYDDCDLPGLTGWKKGDVIQFKLDCNAWKLTVYKNDDKVKTIKIKQNMVYYAAIGSVSNNSQYQILSFD